MHTYEVRLSPRPGTGSGNITVVIQAGSDMEARRIAEAQFLNYRVEAIHRKDRYETGNLFEEVGQ